MAKFTVIPNGYFFMGSTEGQADEQPVHRVWVEAFEMAIYPVTRHDYYNFIKATGRNTPREWNNPVFDGPDLPVVGISWNDAVVYCLWHSSTKELVRLPTEAEWERAARGLSSYKKYPCDETIPEWLPENGKGPLGAPWKVTLGVPNDFGLYGIGANIHEWCKDWHSKTYYANSPSKNPQGPSSGIRRASRGGSWRHAITISSNSGRSKLDPSFGYTDYGFRLVRPHTND